MAPRPVTLRALLIVIAFGLIWAHALGLTQFANPVFIDWMMDGDWTAHLYGWLFTRNGPCGLPLAQAPDLVAPTGSSAALTDAIPLLSVTGKLLSPFFGERMQLFGLWMVGGVIGTGVAGVLACRPWLKDTASLALAGCLFVMNPVVSTRYGHPPFFSFWIITGLVGACCWPVTDLRTARRTGAVTLLLGFLACSVNPYVAVMCSVLVGASLLRLALTRQLNAPEALGWLAAGPLVALTSLWLFGFVAGARSSSTETLGAEGFGQFSADLLTFVNPFNWSRILGALPFNHRQYEGFAYLGLGTLALLVVRAGLLVKFRPSRRDLLLAVPLLLAVGVTSLYSLSNIVTVAGKPIVNFSAFYAKLAPWPSVFRSSGRFIWPLFAFLTMIAALASARLKTPWVRQFVLGGGVLLQLTDFDPSQTRLQHPWPPFVPLKDPAWGLMSEGYRHVVVHPIQIQWQCPYDAPFIASLSWEAYRQHLSINSGYVGRPPAGIDCNAHFPLSSLRDDTVYIPYFPQYFADFQQPQLACGQVEGKLVCVSRAKDTPLLRALLQRSAPR